MQSTSWAHGTFAGAARISRKRHVLCGDRQAINARFNTAYSRNATIGRARRMGLSGPERPDRPASRNRSESPSGAAAQDARTLPCPHRGRCRSSNGPRRCKLRCVGIVPRHLSLLELEPGDCRYPYGGDAEGEAITFCGHPRREGSSYCVVAFSPDARPRHRVGTRRRQGAAAAGGGGMSDRNSRHLACPDQAAVAAASPRASAGADPARAGGFDPRAQLVALLRDQWRRRRKRKPQPVKRAP